MFLDESAFDVEEDLGGVPRLTSSATPKNQTSGTEIKSGRYNNSTDFSRPGTASRGGTDLMNVDDDDLGGTLGSAGSIGASSSSRARMLAQQREIQLKKRQSAMQSGGMVRSSIDTDDEVRASGGSSQFTPAIRQFSAPKLTRETFSNDVEEPPVSPKKSGKGMKSGSRRFDDDDADETSYSRGVEREYRGDRGGDPGYREERDGGRGDRDGGRGYRGDRETGRGYRGDRETGRGYRGSREEDRDYRGGRGPRDRGYDDEYDRSASRGWGDEGSPSRGGYRRGDRGGRREDDGYEDDYDRDHGRGGWDDGPRSNSRSFNRNDGAYDPRRSPAGRGSGRRQGDDGGRGYDRDYDDDRDYGRDYGRHPSRDARDGFRDGRSGGRSRQNFDEDDYDDRYDDRRRGGGRRDYDRDDGRDGKVSGRWQELSHQRSGPLDKGGGSISRGMGGELEAPLVFAPPDLSNMRRFLQTPIPKSCGVIQCYIRRNKSGTNKLFPLYSLYMKEGDVFLMCSKKRPKNKTSNYLISKAEGDISKGGDHYMGKLRSNFVGTEFQVFDDGSSPSGPEAGERTSEHVRTELGSVMYAPNVLGSRGPRKMQVVIPCVDENNEMIKPKNPGGIPFQEGDYLQRMKDHSFRDLVYMINKPPRWNEQVQAYVLNFNGRVTMASVKNFQLVDPEEQNTVLLQFGRVGKDDFTMDMQWPFSPLQAFAVTLSSFDSKIACD